MFIDGAPGIGKKILATEAANKLHTDNRNVVVAYVDCKDIKSLESFAGTVIEQICRSPYHGRSSCRNKEAFNRKQRLLLHFVSG